MKPFSHRVRGHAENNLLNAADTSDGRTRALAGIGFALLDLADAIRGHSKGGDA